MKLVRSYSGLGEYVIIIITMVTPTVAVIVTAVHA